MVSLTKSVSRLLFVVPVVVGLTNVVRAESPDGRYLEGLRQRRLYEQAESYCVDRLSKLQPKDAAQADLTMELIRTLALHAANTPPDQRDALWQKARSSAASFLQQVPPHPRAILVRLQDALTPLAEGELGRQEFEAGVLPADRLEPTRQVLREATSLLESLDRDLTREIPLRRRAAPRPGELSADELLGLAQQVQHQFARAQRNRALLFAPGSDDRLALLLAAVQTLQRLLTQLADDEPLRPNAQLDLAECQRLLGRTQEASELAATLDQVGVAPQVRLRARGELIRLALTQNNLATAQRLIDQGRTVGGQSSPELDFVRFEAFLVLARSASEGTLTRSVSEGRPALTTDTTPSAELAKQYQDQAAQTADLLDETYGPYWGRRAGQLLVAAAPRGATNVALLSRTADSLYLKNNLDQALAAYNDATAQARAVGNLKAAFELSYKAALVEQKRSRHAEAANRLRALSKSLATYEQAPAAHLLAAWNAAQAAQSDAQLAGEYEELLREHLATWPTAESAAQARIWLGKLLQSRSDWSGAIDALAGVSRASPHYPTAIGALAICWRERLAALAAAGQPTDESALQAIRFFRQAIAGPENRWPERWTDADRNSALAAAELIVAYQPGSASDAENLLRTALTRSQGAPHEWQTAAQAQLVVALAGQGGRQDEALNLLRELGAASSLQMLAVLEGLSQISSRSRERSRADIARVQLAAVEMLSPTREQPNGEGQLTFDRVRAEALAATGRREEALAAYAQLAKENPDSGAIQEGYAELLLASSDPAQLKQAHEQWRMIANRTRPRTPRWFKARYSAALAQFKLGDRPIAATLLRYLLDTPPGLQGTGWEEAFRELLQKCQSP